MSKRKYQPLTKEFLSRGIALEFRYTVSRGRDTYGYNICSLYVNGEKVTHCSGGGYDMQGTCLGDWVEMQFPEELKTLEPSWTEGPDYIPCPVCHGKENRKDLCKRCRSPFGQIRNPDYRRGGLYGLTFNRPGAKYGTIRKWQEGDSVQVDGGCGFSCVQAILKGIGYALQWQKTHSKNLAIYILQTHQEWA